MSHTFYPFVEQDAGDAGTSLEDLVRYPARIAVYDDAAAAPRVVIIDPQDVRSYLEEITREVTRLSHEQGGTIPFMVIREIVENYIHDIYLKCVEQLSLPAEEMHNYVKDIYQPFTTDEISTKMLDLLRPDGMTTPIQLVFQSLEGLHQACPHHPGDWYFSGNYPTAGGVRLVNQAYINWYEQNYK